MHPGVCGGRGAVHGVVPAAIVTGSDSGIGKATAVALAREGYDVGVTWHADEAGGEATASEVRALGRTCELRHLDLAELPGSAAVVDELADALGGLDVFVNNAGTSRRRRSSSSTGRTGGTRWPSTSTGPSCARSGRRAG